jgi:hypothetical protein
MGTVRAVCGPCAGWPAAAARQARRIRAGFRFSRKIGSL